MKIVAQILKQISIIIQKRIKEAKQKLENI